MRLVFVEMPAFARRRADYLDDLAFAKLQAALLANPEAGLVIAIYAKGEVVDLTPAERRLMKASIDNELRERRRSP